MYYEICDEGIRQTNRAYWEENGGTIAVFTEEEWEEEAKDLKKYSMDQNDQSIFFCKLEQQNSCLFGTFHIPVKKKEKRFRRFAVYILKGQMIFADYDGMVKEILAQLQKKKHIVSLEVFLKEFFLAFVQEDILYLASMEREIAELEEEVLEGRIPSFNYRMLAVKKEISRLYCYYSQMADVGEVLCEYTKACRNLKERMKRLQQETQSLREYAMQVQDVYQAEIGIRQNDIMKLLTIVTTIFLPLTLIAGWYGMNFYNMPELSWKYGYPVAAGVSVLIVVVSLWFFKKKKFF